MGRSEFKTDCDLRIVDDGWLVINQNIVYYSALLDTEVVVPVGFFTDLASVPKPMRVIVPVANAKNRPAAIVHDYLCDEAVQLVYGINQMNADAVFREALAVCKVNPVGQWAMWAPVRLFQWWKSK